MSSKVELHQKLKQIGYELGPFASKDTLSNIIYLHSLVIEIHNINVAKLNDLELRKNLIGHGRIIGPVTNHTRAIYQRKLLEILTNDTIDGKDDEYEVDEPIILRNDYKATSSLYKDTLSINLKPSIRNVYEDRNLYDDSNDVRARILTKLNEQQFIKNNKNSTSKKVKFNDEYENKNLNNNNDKLQVTKKDNNSIIYTIVTIIIALIVFTLYLYFDEK